MDKTLQDLKDTFIVAIVIKAIFFSLFYGMVFISNLSMPQDVIDVIHEKAQLIDQKIQEM